MQNNTEVNNNLSCYTPEEDEKISKLVEIIKKAADVTHTVLLAGRKSKKALDAAETNDKMLLWNVLQEYIRQYASFINSVTFFTNIRVNEVSGDYYDSITADEMAKQLRMIVKFVYIKEFADSAAKSALKGLVKKMLPKSGTFTEEELKRIL